MKQQAPPAIAGPDRQLKTMKIIYGSAAFFSFCILSLLFNTTALGLLILVVTIVICSLNSKEIAEESLGRHTRLHTASKI